MSFKLLKHRWQKITLIALLAMFGVTIIAALFANSYFAPKLADKIKAEVLKSSDSLYCINIGNTELHILRGTATLYDIKLSVDTSVYNLKKKQGTAPNSLYQLQVNRLVVSHMQLLKLYLKKELNIGRITLNAPEVEIGYHVNQPDTARKDNRTLWQKISKSLKLVNVGEIFLNDVKLKYKDYSGPKVAISKFKQLNLKATSMLIDSATQKDTSRFLFCKDITTELFNYSSKSANGLYNFKIKSVKLSTETSRLIITGLNLQPADHVKFFNTVKDDRFTLRIDSAIFNKFDYQNYREKHDLDVSKITLYKGFFEVYSNYNGKLQTTDRLVTFPNWAIRHAIKAKLNIDTLDLKNFAVTYKQLNKVPMKTGMICFNRINTRFLNLTNKAEKLQKNKIATANVSSYFMGKGKFNISFNFNLTDAAYSYSYKGYLGPIDMAEANPSLMPLSLVKITSGRVKSLDFNIHSTQKTSTGTVSLLYNNLQVDVLRKDYTKKSVITTLANTFILKHDNPDDGGNTPRLAKVAFIRPANFPFFKTVWQTILAGMKPCAGVGKTQEDKFNKQNADDARKEQEDLLKDAKKKKEEEDKKFKEALKKKNEEEKKKG
ncbi:hypothetical protein [Mucilaginibacter psychrotolerans]|uniref:DUF748 domain-containing protein n=1 Tax=Mucilaginibacter psychrotolerans TaxID=1524096 RepID=A0A4Y8SI28_9SPHI|nr:hypothetical protein [Mucilaginibacter psychrotolerans]TFF38300.1 hypothetical protein E2R66_09710 [Mucilaginibacter psychrotolerans]